MHIDLYLTHLQENLWTRFREMVELPRSKHPKLKKINQELARQSTRCKKLHPNEKTTIRGGYSTSKTKTDFEYEKYKANPKQISCLMRARILFLREFLKWVKETDSKEICMYNRNKKRCEIWVQQEKKRADAELKELMTFVQILARPNVPKHIFNKIKEKVG